MNIEFPRPRRTRLTIDMAPLIDVVFLLLVFFMLTSTFLPPALPLDLPGTANREAAPQEPVVVSLDARRVIALNGEVVAPEAFGKRLAALLAESGKSSILFRGDRSVDYGSFLGLMDQARAAGARKMSLVHENE